MPRLVVLQNLGREGPGLFTKIAKEREMEVSIYRLDQGVQLPKLIKGDLLLVLGGPMGIRDLNNATFSWLSDEYYLVKDALEKEINIVGVCLGAQLLAHSAGGDVEVLLDKDTCKPLPEVGWETVSFKEEVIDKLWRPFLGIDFPVLHWHGDRILLPSCAELLASSKRCNEQFFKIGSFAYGLQFHIEIDNRMIDIWINQDYEFIRSALGGNADLILKNQQKLYGNQTLQSRLFFLRRIFDALGY